MIANAHHQKFRVCSDWRVLISVFLLGLIPAGSLKGSDFDCEGEWKALALQSGYEGEERRGVTYLNETQRENYEVKIVGGKFVNARTGRPLNSRWRWRDWISFRSWLNTSLTVAFDLRRDHPESIVVLSEDGKLYAGTPQKDRFHHSSFLAGRPVLFAGGIRFVGGSLVALSNISGHYRPGSKPLREFLAWLIDRGVNLDGVQWSSQDGRFTDVLPSWAAELKESGRRPQTP